MIPGLALATFLQASSSQQSFFTLETLFTAAGSTTAVITVTTVAKGFSQRFPARWFALGFALFLTIVGVHVQGQTYGPATLLLALINALVVYAAAVGVNTVSTAPTHGGGLAAPAAPAALTGRTYRWWN